jgi:hypothetical protein
MSRTAGREPSLPPNTPRQRPRLTVKDRLSDGFDAGKEEVDAGKELLAVVVVAQRFVAGATSR